MSAKFSAKSVSRVKEKLRTWIDDHERRWQQQQQLQESDLPQPPSWGGEPSSAVVSKVREMERRLRDANEPRGPTVI